MRCLFVVDDHPISRDAVGGASIVIRAHLELLAHWNAEIHLLLLRRPERSLGFEEFVKARPREWNGVRGWCASHRIRDLRDAVPSKGLVAAGTRFVSSVRDPYSLFHIAQDEANTGAVGEVVDSVEPDLIWAEELIPALIARRARNGVPMVYGHHDWIWLLLRLSGADGMRGPRGALNARLQRRAEELLVREVDGCVSAAAHEADQLAQLNDRVAYLPATYAWPSEELPASVPSPPRVVHVGGMRAVAGRIGLERFLEIVWPSVAAAFAMPPELLVVGSMDGATETLRARLAAAEARCSGFVLDLDSVLRPYDVHVVPWEHRTGSRTRVPLAMRHGQVVVSTRAAVDGLTGLVDGRNCVLVEHLHEMSNAIRSLLRDDARRREIGRSARETFLAEFTREGVQPRFDAFMTTLERASSRRGGG